MKIKKFNKKSYLGDGTYCSQGVLYEKCNKTIINIVNSIGEIRKINADSIEKNYIQNANGSLEDKFYYTYDEIVKQLEKNDVLLIVTEYYTDYCPSFNRNEFESEIYLYDVSNIK